MFQAFRRFLQRVWRFILAYYIAASYVIRERLYRRFGRTRRLKEIELQGQDARTAVITGGSRGIGLEIVYYLMDYGYNVVIGSSSNQVARTDLENVLKNKYPNSKVEVWHLDLASLSSVTKFANKFFSSGRRLHLLINNAGIMFVPQEITEDGFERHFAVNYLSHFLLTAMLLPLLEESGTPERKSRIINSTSCIHYVANLNLDDLQGRSNYSKYYAYMQSKLAQIMFTYYLQSYLESIGSNVTVNCCHPGVVNTELMNCVWWSSYVGSIFFKTAKQGAETAVYAALAYDMEGNGGNYLEECTIVESSKASRDVDLQRNLWNQTLTFLNRQLDEKQHTSLFKFTVKKPRA